MTQLRKAPHRNAFMDEAAIYHDTRRPSAFKAAFLCTLGALVAAYLLYAGIAHS